MRYMNFIILLILCHASYSQCDNNLLTNGSFTNEEGSIMPAPGWSFSGSPDTNDEIGLLNTTIGYTWVGTPLASPSGGTWQNIFRIETIFQDVELSEGQVYTLCFDYAAQGIVSPNGNLFIDPVGVDVYIDGILSYVSDLDTTQYTWESTCFNFTAANSNTSIKFAVSDETEAYLALDGACLTVASTNSSVYFSEKTTNISVSPNPFVTSTLIKLNTQIKKSFKFILFDSQGRIAHEENNITNDQFILERNNLSKGLYYFQLRSDNQQIMAIGKLIIQ